MKRAPTLPCSPMQRLNYFIGQLLTAEDLKAEQNYFLQKHRRHNLLCHGPGVVQGLQVSVAPKRGSGGSTVTVNPGSAIDPAGNLIQLCGPILLKLPAARASIAVAIRFRETLARPVPSIAEPPADPSPPERYSRIQEDCEVLLLPDAGAGEPPRQNPTDSSPWPPLPLARLVRRNRGWSINRTALATAKKKKGSGLGQASFDPVNGVEAWPLSRILLTTQQC